MIIRTHKSTENPYVMISKIMLYDKELSLKAKGLLCFLLSKPDNWQIYVAQLAQDLKENKDTIAGILNELISNGYLKREQIRESGKIVGYDYTIYETKQTETQETVSETTVSEETGSGFFRSTNIDLVINDQTKEGGEESPPLAEVFQKIHQEGRTQYRRFEISSAHKKRLETWIEKAGPDFVLKVFRDDFVRMKGDKFNIPNIFDDIFPMLEKAWTDEGEILKRVLSEKKEEPPAALKPETPVPIERPTLTPHQKAEIQNLLQNMRQKFGAVA